MTRRLVLLASLMLFALTGCVSYGDGYYRDRYYSDDGYYSDEGYYSDDGYYYPAEEGYGDYYEGDSYDSYYDTSYGYSPFWSLDRYSCGAFYNCSPYWSSYYRRPYSWSLSFGNHWNYGSWGWYDRHWSPWYSGGYYHRPERPHRPDRDPPGRNGPRPLYPEPGTQSAPSHYSQGGPRPRVIGTEPVGGARPGRGGNRLDPDPSGSGEVVTPGSRPRYPESAPGEPVRAVGGEPANAARPEQGAQRPGPRSRYAPLAPTAQPGARPLYREEGVPVRTRPSAAPRSAPDDAYRPAQPRERPATRPMQREEPMARPQPRQYEAPSRPEPRQYEAPSRPEPRQYEAPSRPEPRQYEAPSRPQPRQYEAPARPEPRQYEAPSRPEPRQYEAPSRPEPRAYSPPPRAERQEARESRPSSQNESQSDER